MIIKIFIPPNFREELKSGLENKVADTFEENFLQILDKHAPLDKKQILRANDKTLRKAIMRRSALQNGFYRDMSPEIE